MRVRVSDTAVAHVAVNGLRLDYVTGRTQCARIGSITQQTQHLLSCALWDGP